MDGKIVQFNFSSTIVQTCFINIQDWLFVKRKIGFLLTIVSTKFYQRIHSYYCLILPENSFQAVPDTILELIPNNTLCYIDFFSSSNVTRWIIITSKHWQRIHWKKYLIISDNPFLTVLIQFWEENCGKFLNSTIWNCNMFQVFLSVCGPNFVENLEFKNSLRMKLKEWSFSITFQVPKKFQNNSRNSSIGGHHEIWTKVF